MVKGDRIWLPALARLLALGWLTTLIWVAAGCCSHPGVFNKVQGSLEMVQSFYEPLLQELGAGDERVRRAVVIADTTLLVAGELQRLWCPDPGKAEQLALQAQEAKRLAAEAGVKPAETSPEVKPEDIKQ
jgi:hypothetical protein